MSLCRTCLYKCGDVLSTTVCDKYQNGEDYTTTIYVETRNSIQKTWLKPMRQKKAYV